MNRSTSTYLVVSALLVVFSCSEKRYADPLTPEEALEAFQLREGFRIEVFATEPHVMDPVDMVFDARGNIYVVEMPDYPEMPEEGKGNGRIRILQDKNNDGEIDGSVIFADSLLDATSAMPWNGGMIVTAAPQILFLKDTDGDMRADHKEVLFSGFFEVNSEAQITSLRLGIDNWIYAANNGQAGEVTFTRTPEVPAKSVRGTDFRFRLDRNLFEPETGAAQFGLALDDWGNRFMTQNTLHVRHAVVPWRYLNRRQNVSSAPPLVNISDHELEMFQLTPPPYWRAERTSRRQKQYKEQNLDRVEYAEDHFTGASGGTIYDGDAFPKEYYGNLFTGEVAGNLVHRDVLILLDNTPTFVASRDEKETAHEFLASTDPWFRPVNFAVGPDGYLYVIDMYRQHIETPLSIPEDLKEDMDFFNGSDMGRIYRIVPDNSEARRVLSGINIPEMSTAEIVELLKHPNRWWRRNAQRILLERGDLSAVDALKHLSAKSDDPRTRLHALYALEGLNSVNIQIVRQALNDAHRGVRQHALRLAEAYPELLPDVLKSVNDSSASVVFQATLSLGEFTGPRIRGAFARVLNDYGDDQWFRVAVLSSEEGASPEMIRMVLKEASPSGELAAWKTKFVSDAAAAIGALNQSSEVAAFLALVAQPPLVDNQTVQTAALEGLVKGLKRSTKITPEFKESLDGLKMASVSEVNDAIRLIRNAYPKQ